MNEYLGRAGSVPIGREEQAIDPGTVCRRHFGGIVGGGKPQQPVRRTQPPGRAIDPVGAPGHGERGLIGKDRQVTVRAA